MPRLIPPAPGDEFTGYEGLPAAGAVLAGEAIISDRQGEPFRVTVDGNLLGVFPEVEWRRPAECWRRKETGKMFCRLLPYTVLLLPGREEMLCQRVIWNAE